ncbi:MAG: DNA-3-methyladenine glycosylase 2 family protein [Pseudotabrizicola sp.]|uniref:DNA-3-methyladenine glycosylase family protein n=1 Tax=Pseudotabrizicola sp. TaxID=2939647 RepID=UPI0027229010|nr:DNA-3-methyladenine glycosylase 2 family protein [Pseudotabrizicola sp.]MDO9638095.1 DNA-3-methyladenine glycosylase 2 family protein [Pseudotabrizicola sp.]
MASLRVPKAVRPPASARSAKASSPRSIAAAGLCSSAAALPPTLPLPNAQPPSPVAACRVPPYWADACTHLSERDRVLCKLIPHTPHTGLQSHGDPFVTLVRSVIGQQISVVAAQAVWQRFEKLLPQFEPAALLRLRVDEMRAAGLSARKVEYLVDLALHFDSGQMRPEDWPGMDDEAIVKQLVAIRGIGRWTADMFLIFHLLRPNVLPLDDVGLIRGISQSYFSGEPVSRSDAREVAAPWGPYCSVATWYIWRSLDPLPVAY